MFSPWWLFQIQVAYLPYVNEYLLKPYSLRMYSNVNHGDKEAQRGHDQSHFIIRVGLFPY